MPILVLLPGIDPPRRWRRWKNRRGRSAWIRPVQEHDRGPGAWPAEVVRGSSRAWCPSRATGGDVLDGARRRRVRLAVGSSRRARRSHAAQARAPARAAARRRRAHAPARAEPAPRPTIAQRVGDALARRRRHAGEPQRQRVVRRRQAQQERRWNTIACDRAAAAARSPRARLDGGPAVQQAQQRRLARAVGADQRDARRDARRGRRFARAPRVKRTARPRRRRATPALPFGRSVRHTVRRQRHRTPHSGAEPWPRGAQLMPRLTGRRRRAARDAERHRRRQVALAGLERDGRGRHHARDAVDVAADDHHRADFGDRAAEPGDEHGRTAQRSWTTSAAHAIGPAPSERNWSPPPQPRRRRAAASAPRPPAARGSSARSPSRSA